MFTFSLWAILMIMELIGYAISHSLNIYVQLSSGAEGLVFGLSLHLLLYVLHVSSEGSGKTAPLSEPSLLAYPINIKVSCAGSL